MHIVQKVKYYQKIYNKEQYFPTSQSCSRRQRFYLLGLLPPVFTSVFPIHIHNHGPLFLHWFCHSILISHPVNEFPAFLGHPLPTSPPPSPITLPVTITASVYVILTMQIWFIVESRIYNHLISFLIQPCFFPSRDINCFTFLFAWFSTYLSLNFSTCFEISASLLTIILDTS